jgi:hypothetical protein
MREQIAIGRVAATPAPRDRVAREIDVDPALLRLRQQFLVGDPGVLIGAGNGVIGVAAGRKKLLMMVANPVRRSVNWARPGKRRCMMEP